MRDRLDFFFVKLFGWFLCIILILTIAFGLARVADSKRAEGIALENLNIESISLLAVILTSFSLKFELILVL